MFLVPLLILLPSVGPVDETTREFYQRPSDDEPKGFRAYVIDTSQTAKPKGAEKSIVAFRRNNNYAVWDARGLTVRHGKVSRSMRLEDFPVSNRFWTQDELENTVRLIADKKRKRAASALSGALRVGTDAYFLARWNGNDGKPWTEALVKVGLDGAGTWPEVLGKFQGISIAYKPIDDRLTVLGDSIATVVRDGDRWGVATYNLKEKKFAFRSLGAKLLTYLPTSRRGGVFIEHTAYGTTVGGRVDLISDYRRNVFESRGTARFLDAKSPAIIVARTEDSMRLLNAETGAELRLLPGYAAERVDNRVVVWIASLHPSATRLYSPSRWKLVPSDIVK